MKFTRDLIVKHNSMMILKRKEETNKDYYPVEIECNRLDCNCENGRSAGRQSERSVDSKLPH